MIRLRYSNAHIRDVTELLAVGLEPPLGIREVEGARRWLSRAGPHRLPDFGRVWLAKARLDRVRWGTDPGPVLALLALLRRELSRGPPLRLEELAVNGRDLIGMGLKPGPHFGEILEELLARVLTEPALNDRERLLELVREELVDEGGEDG
jgi:hypothetical protein